MIPARSDVGRAQQALDLPAAAKVHRELVVVVAQPAEIDDASQPVRRRCTGERASGVGVTRLEVTLAQRVDEVVRRVAACAGVQQAVLVCDVCSHGGAGAAIGLRSAGHGPDVVVLGQRVTQPLPDEAGRAGDKYAHAFPPLADGPLAADRGGSSTACANLDLRQEPMHAASRFA
jgi:hypothetical protein